MQKSFKGAIFDLDGTLVDSMWIWSDIDIKYLKNKGIDMPDDLRLNISHLSFEGTAIYFKKTFKLEDSIEQIQKDWYDMSYCHYASDVKLKPGVKEYLKKLKNSNIKIALATSNSAPLYEVCLKHNGIYEYFDSFTETDEVNKGKDSPAIYYLAAKKLNLSPEECIVFEDILPAVKSAKDTGMYVVGVRDDASVDPASEIKKYCDKYIDSFLEML